MEAPTAGAWPPGSYRNSSHSSAAKQLVNHEEIVVNLRTLLCVCVCFVFLKFSALYPHNYFPTTILTEEKIKVQYRSETGCCKTKLNSILNQTTKHGLKTYNALNFQQKIEIIADRDGYLTNDFCL